MTTHKHWLIKCHKNNKKSQSIGKTLHLPFTLYITLQCPHFLEIFPMPWRDLDTI